MAEAAAARVQRLELQMDSRIESIVRAHSPTRGGTGVDSSPVRAVVETWECQGALQERVHHLVQGVRVLGLVPPLAPSLPSWRRWHSS